jgi:hypothetical protein
VITAGALLSALLLLCAAARDQQRERAIEF